MEDAGKYSLIAENKNGSDHVDLDLIVVDEVPVGECDMFRHGTLECLCNYRYRCETSEQEMTRITSTSGSQGDTANEKKFVYILVYMCTYVFFLQILSKNDPNQL